MRVFFSDIIQEVIDQQSTLYDNVTIVANFFKYEQVNNNNNNNDDDDDEDDDDNKVRLTK